MIRLLFLLQRGTNVYTSTEDLYVMFFRSKYRHTLFLNFPRLHILCIT